MIILQVFTLLFQFTLPRGERLFLLFFVFSFTWFQFTLPRGERLKATPEVSVWYVSIHAPARGATRKISPRRINISVSIHAPARGATHHRRSSPPTSERFNSRSREGSDPIEARRFPVLSVSIHAPARGATLTGCAKLREIRVFQFTLPRGERLKQLLPRQCKHKVSIHAPARGATSTSFSIR
mgnify:CR=1 FL=1